MCQARDNNNVGLSLSTYQFTMKSSGCVFSHPYTTVTAGCRHLRTRPIWPVTPPRDILNLQENKKAKKRNTDLQYLVRFILTITKLELRSSCLVDIQVLQDNDETTMSKKSLSSTISWIVARLQHLVCNDHVLLSKLWFKPYGNLSDNCYEVVMHMKHTESYITYNTNSRPEMILRLEFLRAAQRRSRTRKTYPHQTRPTSGGKQDWSRDRSEMGSKIQLRIEHVAEMSDCYMDVLYIDRFEVHRCDVSAAHHVVEMEICLSNFRAP